MENIYEDEFNFFLSLYVYTKNFYRHNKKGGEKKESLKE